MRGSAASSSCAQGEQLRESSDKHSLQPVDALVRKRGHLVFMTSILVRTRIVHYKQSKELFPTNNSKTYQNCWNNSDKYVKCTHIPELFIQVVSTVESLECPKNLTSVTIASLQQVILLRYNFRKLNFEVLHMYIYF